MKKIILYSLFVVFSILLGACNKQWDNDWIEDYVNDLLGFQEQSVNVLYTYYSWLEKKYDGSNLVALFTWTMDELERIEKEVRLYPSWDDDGSLRDAVWDYIAWMEQAFWKYEWTVIETLVDYDGQVSRFYRDNQKTFSDSAMKLASELAILDRQLDASYTAFLQKYSYVK